MLAAALLGTARPAPRLRARPRLHRLPHLHPVGLRPGPVGRSSRTSRSRYGLRYDYITRAIRRQRDLPERPRPQDRTSGCSRSPRRRRSARPSTTQPPCLPAPLDQIPYNQNIRATGEYNSVLPPIKDNFGPRVGLAWQINPKTVLRTGYALMWDSMVSRSQYGQHQFETWGWPQTSGFDTGTINTTGGADPAGRELLVPGNRRAPRPALEQHRLLQRPRPQERLLAPVARGDPAAAHPQPDGERRLRGQLQRPDGVLRPRRRAQDGGDRTRHRTEAHAGRAGRSFGRGPTSTGTSGTRTTSGCPSTTRSSSRCSTASPTGFTSMLSYTWSRTIDTSSGWFDAEGGIGGRPVQNYWDIDDARGLSSYDIPHILTWASIWELPFGRGKRWLNDGAALLDPRELAGQLDAAGPLGSADDRDGGRRPGQPRLQQLRPRRPRGRSAASTIPRPTSGSTRRPLPRPVNAFGSSERNILRAPGFWNVDMTPAEERPVRKRTAAGAPAGGVQRLQPHQRRQPERRHHQRELRQDHRHGRAARGSSSSGLRLVF